MKFRKRVLIISDFFEPITNGIARHVNILAENLSRDIDSIVVTSGASGKGKIIKRNGVKIYFLPSITLKKIYPLALASQRKIEQIIRAEKIDICHCHAFPSFIGRNAYKASEKMNIPFVLADHGQDEHVLYNLKVASLLFRKILKRRYRKLIRKSHAVISVSRKRCSDFKDFAQKVYHIPNFTTCFHFKNIEKPRDGRKRILFVGRLAPEKNIGSLIINCG